MPKSISFTVPSSVTAWKTSSFEEGMGALPSRRFCLASAGSETFSSTVKWGTR